MIGTITKTKIELMDFIHDLQTKYMTKYARTLMI